MSQSLVKNYLHVVYSTKDRTPFLKDKNLRSRLHAYLAGACRNLDSPSIIVGGVADHVHILCMLSKNLAVKDFIWQKQGEKWQTVNCPLGKGQVDFDGFLQLLKKHSIRAHFTYSPLGVVTTIS